MAGEKVLVVDDRIDNIKFLREYVLEPNGYTVTHAENGLDGLHLALNGNLDLIISDIMMPKMGGLEMLEKLRQEGLNVPTILMTFHGSEETAVQAFRLGAQNYIIKPFAINEMLIAVDRALAESRLRQERDELTQTLLTVNQQLQGRLEELRFLYGIGRSVTSLQDLEPILNRIVEASVYLTKAEEGSLMLLDDESGELYLRAAYNFGEKRARSFRVQVEDSIAGQVVRTGRPVMVGGRNQDDSFKVMTGYFVKALLNVPLKVGDAVIGVLAINNKTVVKGFDQNHLHSLTALANYASIAIENARLYERLSAEAEQVNRRLEDEIEARNTELQQLNLQLLKTEKLAALGYMGAGIARSIDGPISKILKQLETLANKAPKEERPTIAALAKEAFHCRKIIQNLVDYSGLRGLHPEETDLNQLVKRTLDHYLKDNPTDKVRVVSQLSEDVSSIRIDRSQMQQALLYLIRHAYQTMLPDGGTLRLMTGASEGDARIMLNYNGYVFSQAELQHIFDPFYETTTHSYGLELPIVHGIIIRHNGSINLQSSSEHGNTFIISLPYDNAINT